MSVRQPYLALFDRGYDSIFVWCMHAILEAGPLGYLFNSKSIHNLKGDCWNDVVDACMDAHSHRLCIT